MSSRDTYLYKFEQSKFLYFRVRWKYFSKFLPNVQFSDGFFVRTLATDDYEQAIWLSRSILRKFSVWHDRGILPLPADPTFALFKKWFEGFFTSAIQEASDCFTTAPTESNSRPSEPSESTLLRLIAQIDQLQQQVSDLHIKSSEPTPVVEKPQPVAQRKGISIKDAVEQFCASKFREVGRSAQQQYRTTFAELVNQLGADFDLSRLDHEAVQKVRAGILALPSGRKNADGSSVPLAAKTINKYFSNLFSICEWAMQAQFLDRNPFAGSLLRLTSATQLRRRPFEVSEINSMLSYTPQHILEGVGYRDAISWFPAIALYSGMRLGEIAGLRLRDIRCEDGIWFFDLSDYRLKTANSNRIVPVHSKLVERGLITYVKQLEQIGSFYLFPELNTGQDQRDGAGTSISRWFNRSLLPRIGIDKTSERAQGLMVDFHCCRHTVASAFKFAGVPGYLAKQLLGHELDDEITWGVYGGTVSTKLSALRDVIEAISYKS